MAFQITIFSMLYFMAFVVYLYWGLSLIRQNSKTRINRAFFALIIAMLFWSIGYSISHTQLDVENALFYRKLASLGMIAFVGNFLHFTILLTQNFDAFKNKKWIYIIHVPIVVLIYAFVLSPSLSSLQYNMIKITNGWINVPALTFWNRLYQSILLLYGGISVYLILKWKEAILEKDIIKQVNHLIVAILGTFSIGFVIDLFGGYLFETPIVEIGPLIILWPIAIMYFTAGKYNVFSADVVEVRENIISEEQQRAIFLVVAGAIFVSGVFTFFVEYYFSGLEGMRSFERSLLLGRPLILGGLILASIHMIKNKSIQTTGTIIYLITSIPFLTLLFADRSAITAWVYSILIIMSALLFNNRILLIGATIFSVFAQRIVWVMFPSNTIVINPFDYVGRIIVIGAAFLIGLYINKMYNAKTKEITYQFEFQKMISDISLDFVNLNSINYNQKIDVLLEKIGRFFEVDRTYLFMINHENNTMSYTNEWCNDGIGEEVGTIEEIPLDVFPWWIKQLKEKQLVYILDVDDMPKEAINEQEQLQRQHVKSLVSVPVMSRDTIQAFIGIDSVAHKKVWTNKKIKLLSIMANLISNGLSQVKADQQVQFMAYYDNLTKLPNRFLFEDRVKQAIELSKRTSKFISVIFVDLDNFKSVNDTIGHKGGDILLKEVAAQLNQILRKTDTIARFGGDEFMIMLNQVSDYPMVEVIAEKIMKIFADSFHINDQDFLVTASAGIAIYPVDGETPEELIKNADIAMYKAKAKGRNQYILCTEDMKAEVANNMELSNDLYRALENDEFIIHYQPQIDLASKKIVGVEALLRWNHSTKGMISPGVFIPIAEKNSLINSIGEWVLKEACLQNKKWQDMGLPHINVAVNLSSVQIINPHIATTIEHIIQETQLDPHYVQLEITESIAIKETHYVVETLNKLKEIGVSIAIDDFGTEYSSLSRLKQLPIDQIKIDMQFVQGIESNNKDKAITMIIINLAKSLGMHVLAEGVETEAQLDFLHQKLCDSVQGYYYYKPLPAASIGKILFDVLSNGDERLTSLDLKLLNEL